MKWTLIIFVLCLSCIEHKTSTCDTPVEVKVDSVKLPDCKIVQTVEIGSYLEDKCRVYSGVLVQNYLDMDMWVEESEWDSDVKFSDTTAVKAAQYQKLLKVKTQLEEKFKTDRRLQ
jgi:hypothetical protein